MNTDGLECAPGGDDPGLQTALAPMGTVCILSELIHVWTGAGPVNSGYRIFLPAWVGVRLLEQATWHS